MWAYSDKEYVIIECSKHFHQEMVLTTKGVLTYEQFYIVKFRDFMVGPQKIDSTKSKLANNFYEFLLQFSFFRLV